MQSESTSYLNTTLPAPQDENTARRFENPEPGKTANANHNKPDDEFRAGLREAGERLENKGLSGCSDTLHTTPLQESLSSRLPQGGFLISFPPDGGSLAFVRKTDMQVLSMNLEPVEGHPLSLKQQYMAALHASLYMARPDVGAILINQQPWGSALRLLDHSMPAVFDEQARQLGRLIAHLPEDPVIIGEDGPGLTNSAGEVIGTGANAFLFSGGVLLLGMTRERVIFNAELLEKCAKAYLLASATGRPIAHLPFYVRFIANRRLLKDEARSSAAHSRGEIPGGFTAY